MSERDNGGPAFPTEPRFNSEETEGGDKMHFYAGHYGMTLRDYFAAKVMASIWSGPTITHIHVLSKNEKKSPDETISLMAYAQADAMLKERAKP